MTKKISVISLLLISLVYVQGRRVTPVVVNKCCKNEETLTKDFKCIYSGDLKWSLNIYIIGKKNISKENKPPENWTIREATLPNCTDYEMLYSQSKSYVPFRNGSLWQLSDNSLLHPNNYCIDYTSAVVCKKEKDPEELNKVEINKCCGKDAIFFESRKGCVSMKGENYLIKLGHDKVLSQGFPDCEEQKYGFVGKLDSAKMLDNGSLLLEGMNQSIAPSSYCLEHVIENASQWPSIWVCHDVIRGRQETSPNGEWDIRFTLFSIGLAISAIFLAATLVAGSLLPASHHVLHWRCQTNHVICLLIGDVLLCITQLVGRMSQVPCFAIAVLMHFLFLAAFFWLNTMCFNIWWTFRDLRPQSNEKSQERCRLRIYHVYAWGVPFLIAATAAGLEWVPESQSAGILKPGFAKNSCWFDPKGTMEILTFFYGPMGILLLINVTLFTITARELTCGLWKREYVKSTTERAALGRVCLKLVVVMGITWIADIISWVAGGPHEIWYFTDLINCLQGVFIFLVVGFQPQVLTAIKRLICLRKYRDQRANGTTHHHSSSSQGIQSLGDTLTNSVNNTTKSAPLETSC